MIPEVLEIADFISYSSPPPLDLRGLHVVCLSGPNGHGKSALLDALTWALWGRARGCEGGQHQDRIVRDGAARAVVRLTFRAGAERFRVRRRRDRRGRGDLRFEVEAPSGWRDLTAGSVGETEALIVERLRLDYPSFVHSSYLAQGQASAFSGLTPARRFEVLTRLLGCDAYALLLDEAKARLRKDEALLAAASARRDQEDARAHALAPLPGERRVAADEAEVAEKAHREAELALEHALDVSAEHRVIDERIALLDDRLRSLSAEDARDHDQLSKLRALLAEGGPAQKDDVVALLGLPVDGRRRLEEARSELAELKARAASAEAVAEAWLAELRRRARGPFATQLPAARRELACAEGRLAAAEEAAARRLSAEADLQATSARRSALDAALSAALDRVERARQVLDDLLGSSSCPTCGGPLTDQALMHVRAALDIAESEAREQSSRRGEAVRLERAAREASRGSNPPAPWGEACAPTRAGEKLRTPESDDVSRCRRTLSEAGATLVRLERDANDAAEAASELAVLETQRALVASGELAKIEDLAVEVRRWEAAARQHVRLELERELALLLGRVSAREAERKELASRREALSARAATPMLDVDNLRAHLHAATARRDAARAAVILAEQRTRDHGEAKRTAAAAAKEAASASREAEAHRRLVEAFGRHGIPARIVEASLPEIQAEANALLDRLSDGSLAVSIETVRESGKGTLADTLDVTVWAGGTPRDASLLSGGEAFRVSFAIRVGLSRLLARRSGSPLETLVLDEGFGTQDETGRSLVIDALTRVADQFGLVVVITHIDEVKDRFADRVEVRRHPSLGSIAQVVGSLDQNSRVRDGLIRDAR